MRILARRLAAGRLRIDCSGLDNIPATGPALIVARHYHHAYDGLALLAAMPRPFHLVVTLDWARNRRTKFLIETLARLAGWPALLRADAVARADKQPDPLFSPGDVLRYQLRALRQSVDLLTGGRIVVVFPEGYPNIDPHYTPKIGAEEFLPFKEGFFSIAVAAERRLQQNLPIVPAGLCYTAGTRWSVHLSFGKAVYRRQFSGGRAASLALQHRVQRLSDPGAVPED